MRIGVMLRHYQQHQGGVRVYTHHLLDAMLDLASDHEFVFLYRDPSLIGTYARHSQVREIALPAPSTVLWDQVAVPRAVREENIDLVFNPKYSIPLAVRCPAVWV